MDIDKNFPRKNLEFISGEFSKALKTEIKYFLKLTLTFNTNFKF